MVLSLPQPKHTEIPSWIQYVAQGQGKTIANDGATLLQDLVGDSIQDLAAAVEKLALFVGKEKRIPRSAVEQTISRLRVESVFELAAFISAGRRKQGACRLEPSSGQRRTPAVHSQHDNAPVSSYSDGTPASASRGPPPRNSKRRLKSRPLSCKSLYLRLGRFHGHDWKHLMNGSGERIGRSRARAHRRKCCWSSWCWICADRNTLWVVGSVFPITRNKIRLFTDNLIVESVFLCRGVVQKKTEQKTPHPGSLKISVWGVTYQ